MSEKTKRDWQGQDITEPESPDKLIKVWQFQPHYDSDEFTHCVVREWQRLVPAISDMITAQLEGRDYEVGDSLDVKIQLVEMRLQEYEEMCQS